MSNSGKTLQTNTVVQTLEDAIQEALKETIKPVKVI